MLVTFSGQRAKYERGLLLAIMSLTTVVQPQMLRIIVVSNKYLLFLLRLLQTAYCEIDIRFDNRFQKPWIGRWPSSLDFINFKYK